MMRGAFLPLGLVCLAVVAGGCGDDKSSPGSAGQAGSASPSAGAAGAAGSPVAGSGGSLSSGGSVSVAGASGGSLPSGGAAGATGGSAGASGGTDGTAGASGGDGGTAGAPTGGSPSGGSGGSSGGGAVELKMPIQRSAGYTLEFGDLLFVADPSKGGRVTTFAYAGQNILTGPEQDMSGPEKYNWGSTFWPSPQTNDAWGGMNWPPIPEIDSGAYTAALEGTTVVMTSATSTRGRMSLVKKFAPVLDAQAIDLTYTLKNEGTSPMSWAPWQITRVPQSGLTFFPTGASVVNLTMNALDQSKVVSMGGVSWYKNQPSDAGKYSADGLEGWMGYVTGDLLLVKKFPDVPVAQQAPNEGDAEIYAGMGYMEVEVQGPLQTLAPGASLTWTVRWYLRKLADPSMATVGNAALVTLARDVIQQ